MPRRYTPFAWFLPCLIWIFYWRLVIDFSGGSREGARGSARPLFFLNQTDARRAEKKIFGDRATPLSKGLVDRRPSPPLSLYLKVWIRHWTFNMHEHVADKTYAHKGDTVVIVKIREMAVLTDWLWLVTCDSLTAWAFLNENHFWFVQPNLSGEEKIH